MDSGSGNISKKIIVEALIEKIKKDEEGSDIKTRLVEGYEEPEKIIGKDDPENEFVPDVVSETDEKTDLYEIELDENSYLPEKWRSYDRYLEDSGGTFSIITPKNNLDTLKELLKLNKIKARLIYFSD
jgi:hypothetical protein